MTARYEGVKIRADVVLVLLEKVIGPLVDRRAIDAARIIELEATVTRLRGQLDAPPEPIAWVSEEVRARFRVPA